MLEPSRVAWLDADGGGRPRSGIVVSKTRSVGPRTRDEERQRAGTGFRTPLGLQSGLQSLPVTEAGERGSTPPMPIVTAHLVRLRGGCGGVPSTLCRAGIRARRGLVVGCLLVGLAGCGQDGGGDRDGSGAASAVAYPSAAISRSPAASPGPSIAVGRSPKPPVGGPPLLPTPSGSPAPFRSPAADIGPIVWTTAVDPRTNAPLDPVTLFPGDAPTIFATVSLARWEPRATISAEWSYNGTPLDAFATTVVADRSQRDVWLEFHLSKDPAASWPDGVYAIALLVDGQPAQAASVVVGTEGRG